MLAVVREAVKNDNYCNHVANICNMRLYRRLTAASSTETATPFSMKTGQARTEAEVAKRAGSAIQEKENPWGYWGCRAPHSWNGLYLYPIHGRRSVEATEAEGAPRWLQNEPLEAETHR